MWWAQYLLPIVFLGLIVWTHYILFVGDEREMADCSKTDVFLEELDRMCKSKTCSECKLSIYNNYSGEMGCDEYMRNYWYDAIKAVQKWSDEHPIKTRQSEFLKMFPNTILFAPFSNVKVLNLCPKDLDCDFLCNAPDKSCLDCKIDYWLSEAE